MSPHTYNRQRFLVIHRLLARDVHCDSAHPFFILRQDSVSYVHYVANQILRRNKLNKNCLDYLESA